MVKSRAVNAQLQHLRFLVQGGAVRESAMVRNLQLVLEVTPEPHVINLSAGGHTRNGFRPKAFRRIWNETLKHLEDTVLVAAAGNDGTNDPFYPAAFGWAVGVGSLDNDGDISSFSNYGSSADLYVVGRNHVNAYPHGTYVCKETPDKDDVRVFDRGLARWSGTSFAAPLVAGLGRRSAERGRQPDRQADRPELGQRDPGGAAPAARALPPAPAAVRLSRPAALSRR